MNREMFDVGNYCLNLGCYNKTTSLQRLKCYCLNKNILKIVLGEHSFVLLNICITKYYLSKEYQYLNSSNSRGRILAHSYDYTHVQKIKMGYWLSNPILL